MPQLFSRAADAWLRAALVAIVGLPALTVAILMAVVRSPYLTDQGVSVQQPVPFSHQHHVADAGIDCRYCHTSVEESPTAGMPSTEICMNCHRALWTDAPTLALVRASWRSEQPLRWNRVHDLPDFAYFNHSIHVHNGIGCYSCHGRIGEMPLVRQAAPLTMQWCLDCHRNPAEHVRPRSLVYEPKPLSELTDLAEYREAVRETLGEFPQSHEKAPANKPSAEEKQPEKKLPESHPPEQTSSSAPREPGKEKSTARPSQHGVPHEQLAQLRSALAQKYDLKRRTDCYTCHR